MHLLSLFQSLFMRKTVFSYSLFFFSLRQLSLKPCAHLLVSKESPSASCTLGIVFVLCYTHGALPESWINGPGLSGKFKHWNRSILFSFFFLIKILCIIFFLRSQGIIFLRVIQRRRHSSYGRTGGTHLVAFTFQWSSQSLTHPSIFQRYQILVNCDVDPRTSRGPKPSTFAEGRMHFFSWDEEVNL